MWCGAELSAPAPSEQPRTAKSFCIPKDHIAAAGYDLSLNRYKSQNGEHESPAAILAAFPQVRSSVKATSFFFVVTCVILSVRFFGCSWCHAMLFQMKSNVGVPAVNGSTRNGVGRETIFGRVEGKSGAGRYCCKSQHPVYGPQQSNPRGSLATIEIIDAPASDCGFPHRASDHSLLALAGSSIAKFRKRGDQSAASARQHLQA